MKPIFDTAAKAIKQFLSSREEKLGLAKGFPIETFVYVKSLPTKCSVTNSMMEDTHFFHASYRGHDQWKINELQVEPHEMGTDIVDVAKPYIVSTQELINLFQSKFDIYPDQSIAPYWKGTHFSIAKAQIETLASIQPAEPELGIA